MKIKYIFLFSGIAFLSLTACEGQKNKETSSKLTSSNDSVSYAIGVSIGGNLKKDNLDEINVDLIANGIKAAMKNDSSVMKSADAQASIQGFMMAREKKKADDNLAKGKKFLDENAKKDGVKTTASGLQYQIIKDATGPKPSMTDKVSVHYHGTLLNGEIFDSSVQRGKPYELEVNRFVPGFSEALQLMSVGSKYKIWVPGNIAYGERSPGGSIGPNETLVFEVELMAILPADAPKQPGK